MEGYKVSIKDNEAILKVVKKSFDTDNEKAVAILTAEVQEMLYGMSEQEFIQKASVLPPRKVNGDKIAE